MTEQEWLAYTDPAPMLEFLRGRATDRKLRLFGWACFRCTWPLLDAEWKRMVLAQKFSAAGQFLQAEQAYALAFEAKPANAPILWDRALDLQQAATSEDAQRVFQELADGQWPAGYQWAQRQARQHLKRE